MTPGNSVTSNGRDSRSQSDGVAIIGMSCLFPGAANVDAFWRNILGKVDAVTDPPAEAWDSNVYYDPTFADKDKVYCQRGGYLGSLVSFDPLPHGIPPVAVGGEPDQWLALQLAHDAMSDAGCLDLPEDIRRRTEVILGKGTYLNGGNAIAVEHGLVIGQTIEIIRKLNPEFSDAQIEQLREEMKSVLPPMNAETVPGLIPNIIVGRIANRMDLMGPAYTVDAACASSLIAVQHAMRDLIIGDCDLALVGGAQVWMPVPTLNVFCQLGALSRRQQIRPFDQDADGTLLGEGIGMVVLKRLSDAERDGNRIYAVIRGAGMSSDGRGTSVMAPRIEGEELALRRAYDSSGISPRTIGLIEAHGTATPVGDVVEIQALTRVFGERKDAFPHCAIGTVKSMISHTIPASGVAGLIKTALALHHKVLPPTINCDMPNPKLELEKTPFYVNTEARPWIHGGPEPRRAGINSFGFGGINAHVIVEEYAEPPTIAGEQHGSQMRGHLPAWESEVFILEGTSAASIVSEIDRLAEFLSGSGDQSETPSFALSDLAHSVNSRLGGIADSLRLAIIATDLGDLTAKLDRAKQKLSDPTCKRIKEVSGIYYFSRPLARTGKTALLFPGEGSQYTHMLADLCLHFPEVRAWFDRGDRIYRDHPRGTVLSDVLYPRPTFTDSARLESEHRLMQMDMAIEAVLTANAAVHTLLTGLGIEADVVVGHSTGEYSAMAAAGAMDLTTDDQVAAFSLALNRHYPAASNSDGIPRAMMLAIGAGREQAESIAREAGGDVFLAMDNCPHQAVLVGERSAVERAREITKREQLIYEELTFDRAYHTALFKPYAENLRAVFDEVEIHEPAIALYSCTTAAEYPSDPGAVRELIIEHWSSPVEFQRTIETLHDSGVRLFVESGPRGNLSAFVEDILRGREFSAIPANVMRRSGVTQLNHLVGQLAAHGMDLNWDFLFQYRPVRRIELDSPANSGATPRAGRKIGLSTTWPMLTISDETANDLRSQANAPASPERSPVVFSAAPSSDQLLESPAAATSDEIIGEGPAADVQASEADFSALEFEPPIDVSAPSAGPEILQSFFETMGEFLTTQEDVMQAFFAGGWLEDPSNQPVWNAAVEIDSDQWRLTGTSGSPSRHTLGSSTSESRRATNKPLLGAIVDHVPGIALTARRVIDRDEDLYLDDHTLGHGLAGSRGSAMAMMPLTMSLEILAEAAAALRPGRTVVGLRDVRAYRWLAFDDRPQQIQVSATTLPPVPGVDLVRVTLTNLSEDERKDADAASPVVEAIVELADRYSLAPIPQSEVLGSPSRLAGPELYRSVMFHGPMWQGVESMDVVGSSGAEATLRVLPSNRFFRQLSRPEFEIDPITLDAAGQVVGFWTSELLETGKIVFPFRVERIDIYGPAASCGSRVQCRAAIQLIGDRLTTSTIDVIGEDGRLWMRITGWQDKRFDLPAQFEPLMLPDGTTDLSTIWHAPMMPYGENGVIECRRSLASIESDRAFWLHVWSSAVLNAEERDEFHLLRTPEPRRLEWLAARTSAKEAVRSLARLHFGLDIKPADILIFHDDLGAPQVHCAAFAGSGVTPVVSLTHSAGHAAALAGIVATSGGKPTAGIGIDMEQLRPLPEGFIETALDESERAILDTMGLGDSDEWLLRSWCAKEAIAKALGSGLVHGPGSVLITSIEPSLGIIIARTTGALVGTSSQAHMAHTGCDAELIFATAACELHRYEDQ